MLKVKKILLFPVFIWMNILLVNCGCLDDPRGEKDNIETIKKDNIETIKNETKEKEDIFYRMLEEPFISPANIAKRKLVIDKIKNTVSVENLDLIIKAWEILQELVKEYYKLGRDLTEEEKEEMFKRKFSGKNMQQAKEEIINKISLDCLDIPENVPDIITISVFNESDPMHEAHNQYQKFMSQYIEILKSIKKEKEIKQ